MKEGPEPLLFFSKTLQSMRCLLAVMGNELKKIEHNGSQITQHPKMLKETGLRLKQEVEVRYFVLAFFFYEVTYRRNLTTLINLMGWILLCQGITRGMQCWRASVSSSIWVMYYVQSTYRISINPRASMFVVSRAQRGHYIRGWLEGSLISGITRVCGVHNMFSAEQISSVYSHYRVSKRTGNLKDARKTRDN